MGGWSAEDRLENGLQKVAAFHGGRSNDPWFQLPGWLKETISLTKEEKVVAPSARSAILQGNQAFS